MAETELTVTELGPYGEEIEDVDDDASLQATDSANNNFFYHPGGSVLVLIENLSAGSLDVIFEGVASNRTFGVATDLTTSTGASKRSVVQIPAAGFTNSSGKVILTIADSTSLKVGIYKLVTPQ